MPGPVYLDNNATTAMTPSVLEAVGSALTRFGNPSSAHSLGTEARALVEAARESVAALLGANPDEIVFTSGGTESDNWAIRGTLAASPDKAHVVTTRVEHEAVRRLCEELEGGGSEVTWLDVDQKGRLDMDQVREAIRPDTAVVSVMMANNETGVIFPVGEIAEIVKERSNAVFHVDGVNAAGKVPIDLRNTKIDLFSISAHKFHGPKGVGALYIRNGVKISPFLIGGGQESGLRAGTEAVHQIAGLGAAAEVARDLAPMDRVKELRDRLEAEILKRFDLASVNGDTTARLPNTLNISFQGLNGEMILHYLDEAGICVSTGSACNSASHVSSPVLSAMDIPYSMAMGSIRFSLSRFTAPDEINRTISALEGIISKLRQG